MDQPEDRSAWPQGALVRAGRAATRPSRQRSQASARQDCLMGWNRNDRALRQSTRITLISGVSGAIAILQAPEDSGPERSVTPASGSRAIQKLSCRSPVSGWVHRVGSMGSSINQALQLVCSQKDLPADMVPASKPPTPAASVLLPASEERMAG